MKDMEDERVLADLCEVAGKSKPEQYAKIIEERGTYPYLYHLSLSRMNLIEWMPLSKGMHVLERGALCGALTAGLVNKVRRVTAVTPDVAHGKVLDARCAQSANLRILLEEEWQESAAQMEGEYDVVLICGDFWSYKDELPLYYKLLRSDGKLIVADANRLGLRYFAGCQDAYAGGYFTGVEDYPGAAGGARAYSRSEYESILREAGFLGQAFYYPYPDHEFPTSIYSDGWMPSEGELTENRRNFSMDRLQVFDEARAFDSILREGLFGTFSNSFLIIADKQEYGRKWNVQYVRYSNERDKRFCVRTEIATEPSGARYVYKIPQYAEGVEHIASLAARGKALSDAYAGSGISFCQCEQTGRGARFPYIAGCSLEDLLRGAAKKGDRDTVMRILGAYARRLRASGGKVPFVATEGFSRAFGDARPGEGEECALVSNVDMAFSNIMIEKEHLWSEALRWEEQVPWVVIDYEWTFDFPVPKAFVIYRGLYYAYHQILSSMGFGLEEVLSVADIGIEQSKIFARMEKSFQAYLGTGALPVRNMQRRMGTRVTRLSDLIARGGADGGAGLPAEAQWLKVRRIRYKVDRVERQDGSVIASGWAVATLRDGRSLPVAVRVVDEKGEEVPSEVVRTDREDVARQLRIRRATKTEWGFDCSWLEREGERARLVFSLGNREATCPT